MVQFGGPAVRTVPLDLNQHLICLGIGSFSLINGIIVKAILPVSWFEKVKISEEPLTEEQKAKSLHTSLRKSKTLRAHGSQSNIGLTRSKTLLGSGSNPQAQL